MSLLSLCRPTERAGLTTRLLAGTADPSQEYILRDLSGSEDERIRQTQPNGGTPAALTSMAFGIMQACVDPVLQVTQLSCLFLNGLTSGSCRFSLGLSLILEEVAGGGGCLRPLLALRPQRWGTRAPHFFFISKSCTCCSPESKHF